MTIDKKLTNSSPDPQAFNRDAWNREVENGNRWTIPVDADTIARAKNGDWSILLTPTRPVPRDWFPATLTGTDVLCLASGGGQQAPVLAAAGATVTVLDNSPAQLAQDRRVAEREGLNIRIEEGGMADLTRFAYESFDLIVHPCSNCFVPDIRPVWREAFRVLRPGGTLLSGFTNPVRYLFDEREEERGNLVIRHQIPYSDLTSLNDDEREQVMKSRPLEFGHSLEDQIAGQLAAGFLLTGFYEDRYGAGREDIVSRYLATFIASRAIK